jgi:hypothetical protein
MSTLTAGPGNEADPVALVDVGCVAFVRGVAVLSVIAVGRYWGSAMTSREPPER